MHRESGLEFSNSQTQEAALEQVMCRKIAALNLFMLPLGLLLLTAPCSAAEINSETDGKALYQAFQNPDLSENEQLYYLVKCAQTTYPECLKKMGHVFLYGLSVDKDNFQAALLLSVAEELGESSKSKRIALNFLTDDEKTQLTSALNKGNDHALTLVEWPSVQYPVDKKDQPSLTIASDSKGFTEKNYGRTISQLTPEEIAWLQAKIKSLGFYGGRVDGILGPGTIKALEIYLRGMAEFVSPQLKEVLLNEPKLTSLVRNLNYRSVASLLSGSTEAFSAFENGEIIRPKTIPVSYGSGFFVNTRGYLVTNWHVVDSCDLSTYLTNGKHIPLGLVSASPESDLAILKSSIEDVAAVSIKYPLSYEIGTEVYAAGFPLAGSVATTDLQLHAGNISAEFASDDVPGWFQTSITLNAGNSGGPIIDRSGNLVGVAVAKLSQLQKRFLNADGIHYAIKSKLLVNLLNRSELKYNLHDSSISKSGVAIGLEAREYTRHVFCWKEDG